MARFRKEAGEVALLLEILYTERRSRILTVELQTVLHRDRNIMHAALNADETVMLSITASRYYGLNSVASRIWELLETPMTVAQVCARLCEEFEVDLQECQTEVLKFANRLIENGIVHAA